MLICLVALGGLLLRLPLLNDSLWYDEIAAFWYYGQFGPGPIIGNLFTPANHIAQSLATWGSVTLNHGNLDPITLRLPALLFGLASLWPMWVLIRTSLGERWPLLGIGLLALCPIAVLESTEARGYAFMLFFSASACALLVSYLRDQRRALLPWYALCCALGIWSHLVSAVVPIGHACLLIVMTSFIPTMSRQSLWGLGSLALAGVTSLALLAPGLPDLWEGVSAYRALDGDQPTLIGREGRWLFLGLGGSWAYLGGLAGLALVAGGVLGARGRPMLIRGLLVCGLPVAVALILIVLIGTWIYARFLVLGIPFSILAITAGFALITRRTRLVGNLLLLAVVIGWGADLWYRYAVPRQPVREIMERIPSDQSRIMAVGVVDFPIILSWYVSDPTRILDGGQTLAEASSRTGIKNVEWVVIGYPQKTLSNIDLRGGLQRGDGSLLENFSVDAFRKGWIDEDGSMILLRRDAPAADGQS